MLERPTPYICGECRYGRAASWQTLTGRAGAVSFVLQEVGGADVITDFSLADSDGDGRPDDQIDVSNLTNVTVGPVKAGDVMVTDNGFGNAKLTSPERETLRLQGVTPAQMATAGAAWYRAGLWPDGATGGHIRGIALRAAGHLR